MHREITGKVKRLGISPIQKQRVAKKHIAAGWQQALYLLR